MLFSLRAGLWVAVCARCLRWGAGCAKFARLDSFPHVDSFRIFFSEFKITEPSSPKGTVRRCCCPSTMFLDGSYAGCLPKITAQKTPSAPRPTHAAGDLSAVMFHTRAYVRQIGFSVHTRGDFAGPAHVLLIFLHANDRHQKKP